MKINPVIYWRKKEGERTSVCVGGVLQNDF